MSLSASVPALASSGHAERLHQFQHLLIELASSFINIPLTEITPAIRYALGIMASFCEADRAYIFEYDFVRGLAFNIHEHCADGITPQIDALQAIPMAHFESWVNAHQQGDPVYIARVSDLPPGPERETLAMQDIQSLLSLPLMDGHQCIGMVGFDWVRQPHGQSDEDIRLLRLFATLIVNLQIRVHTQDRLQIAANVFEFSGDAIMVTDTAGKIRDVNRAFEKITGYDKSEIIGRNPRILSSGIHEKSFYDAMWKEVREHGVWSGEIWNRKKSGEIYAEHLTISSVKDDQGDTKQYVALFTDITERKRHESQLEKLAFHDTLTGLPNRFLLADKLQAALRQAVLGETQVVVAYIDLDGFKQVNDHWGHRVGDKLLQEIAANMAGVLSRGDTLARVGGDEFVAVLTDIDTVEQAMSQLQRLLETIGHTGETEFGRLHVTGSIGFTTYPQDQPIEAEQLLRQADLAMYAAKLSGKNRIDRFDTEKDIEQKALFASISNFREALDRGELVLHYQPQVHMRTGKIVGAEALIRWQDPRRGLIPPSAFLPAVENNPLAIEMGRWVMRQALTQSLEWAQQGLDITVSVNICALHLQEPGFADHLRTVIDQHAGNGNTRLKIEVVETSALEDFTQISGLIEQCGRIGVDFAIDDFGSGYSSLTYLKRLPAKQVKIDQSFVRDLFAQEEDVAILEGVVSLATSLGREVIAEGVETTEHGEVLLLLGCELAQGYGIARPLPGAEFLPWANQWQPPPSWSRIEALGRECLGLLVAFIRVRWWIDRLREASLNSHAVPPPWPLDDDKMRRTLSCIGDHCGPDAPIGTMLEELHAAVIGATTSTGTLPTASLLESVEGLFRRWEAGVRRQLGIDASH